MSGLNPKISPMHLRVLRKNKCETLCKAKGEAYNTTNHIEFVTCKKCKKLFKNQGKK